MVGGGGRWWTIISMTDGNIAFLFSKTFLSMAAKVPQERKLKGTKVVCGAYVPRVRMFHGTKVPQERKFSMDFSLPGTKVQRNEKARYPACTP